jgi:thioredoxin reductase
MLRKEYDLIVLGAGPTGVTAALAASAAGRCVNCTLLAISVTETKKSALYPWYDFESIQKLSVNMNPSPV